MQNRHTLAAALGLLAVGLGAFGAHGLEARLTAAGTAATWQTAVLYHLVHALAVLAVASSREGAAEKWLRRAARCWVAGVVLFSGSLYVYALGGPHGSVYVTPFGGVALLAGWACLFGIRGASERRNDGATE